MSHESTKANLPQSSESVKSYQLPLFDLTPETMIHHKVSSLSKRIIERGKVYGVSSSYQVPRSRRVLSPGLFRKRYHDIRRCLVEVLGLTLAQREVTLRLLRFWAYYGLVCPRESTITEPPGCSKATFWRTIRILEELELVQVVNRYVIRPHAQISNLYRFDRLMIYLARYLAERGAQFLDKWLKPYLALPGRVFWGSLAPCQENRAGPYGSAY